MPYSIGIVRHCAPNVIVNVYTPSARLGGRHTDIAAHAVMDNDRHGRVHALVGGVVDATERHGVSAAGLDVPELDAAAVRIGVDAVGTASHIRYVAVAQVVRGAGATHHHTHCDRRDNGDPCTFNIWFHFYFFVLFWVLGAIPVAIQDVGIGC